MKKPLLLIFSFFFFFQTTHAAPSVSLIPSRTSGVAPLSVFFDATGTTDPSVTSKPFHELEYTWNFGDDDNVTWTTGAHVGDGSIYAKKNRASGAVAAHVFETGKTYDVTLTVYDGTNSVTQHQTITVTDPNTDTAFAGNKTICFSTSGDFAGCPNTDPSQHITTSDFASAINTYQSTSKRLLFRAGETWTPTGTATITAAGPGLIGSFGSGAAPKINHTTGSTILIINGADWRVMDMDMDGGSNTSLQMQAVNINTDNNTILRVQTHNVNYGFGVGGANNFIVDSRMTLGAGTSAYGAFVSATNFAFMGNYDDIGYTYGVHGLRVRSVQNAVISNNTAKATHFTAFVIHGPPGGPGYTQNVEFADNKVFGTDSGAASMPTSFGPQNTGTKENLKDIIIERNSFVSGPTQATGVGVNAVSGATIRNNIFDVTGGGIHQAISVAYDNLVGAQMTDGISIYNNSVYDADSDSNFRLVRFTGALTSACHVDIKNNIGYAPGTTGPLFIYPQGPLQCTVTGANGTLGNSSDVQLKTNPFSNVSSFALALSAYPVGAGTFTLGALSDFFGVRRGSTVDSGAVQFSSGGSPPPPPPPPSTPAPVVTLSVSPTTGVVNTVNAMLTWSATNSPTSCSASGDWSGTQAASGSLSQGVLTSVKTYTYTLSCTNAGGTGTATASVAVGATTPPPPPPVIPPTTTPTTPTPPVTTTTGTNPPTVTFTASASSVSAGSVVLLSWDVRQANFCSASGDWSGGVVLPNGGVSTDPLQKSSTYTLTCTGAGGVTTKTVSVSLPGTGTTPSSPATSSSGLPNILPGSGSLTDASGHIWTLTPAAPGVDTPILKDGVSASGGSGLVLVLKDGVIYTKNSGNTWFKFTSTWTVTTDPGPLATPSTQNTSSPATTTATPTTFTRNLSLSLRSTGSDVKSLQKYLNAHGYTIASTGPGSPNNETTTFGPATTRALIKYQLAHNLPGSGLFGPMTRALVNAGK